MTKSAEKGKTFEAASPNQNSNQNQNQNQLASQLLVFLRIIRLSGTCPLSWQKEKNSSCSCSFSCDSAPCQKSHHVQMKCYLSWKSSSVYLTLLLILGSTYVLTLFALNVPFEIYWPRKLFSWTRSQMSSVFPETTVSETTLTILFYVSCTMPVLQYLYMLSVLAKFPAFLRLLNALFRMEGILRECFQNHEVNFQIRTFVHRVLFFGLVIPGLGILPSFLFYMQNKGLDSSFPPEKYIVATFMFFSMGFVFIDDIKFVVLCRIIQEFYRQLQKGMKAERLHIENLNQREGNPTDIPNANVDFNQNPLNTQKVKNWLKFLLQIRQSCTELGQVVKISQLFLIWEVLMNFTVCLYALIDMVITHHRHFGHSQGDDWIGFSLYRLVVVSFYSFIAFIRLYIKTLTVEKITQEENVLAQEIICMQDFPNVIDTQLELKSMFELIHRSPVKVNLGGYVTLNKKLFLKISNQTIVYLIVLLQFGRILGEN